MVDVTGDKSCGCCRRVSSHTKKKKNGATRQFIYLYIGELNKGKQTKMMNSDKEKNGELPSVEVCAKLENNFSPVFLHHFYYFYYYYNYCSRWSIREKEMPIERTKSLSVYYYLAIINILPLTI